MFERLIADLERLGNSEVQIVASGEYPTKRRTKVADVAVYQNDGTETIKASRFVQRATTKHRGWAGILFKSASDFLFRRHDLRQSLQNAGIKVSFDIGAVCDRIKTGRLKKSFIPEIK